MEEEIIKIIEEILERGYKIVFTKNSIEIIETYSSLSREKYKEETAFEVFGSLRYFEKGTLRITLEKLKLFKNRNLTIKN